MTDQQIVRVQRAKEGGKDRSKHAKAFQQGVSEQLKQLHSSFQPALEVGSHTSVGTLLKPEDRDRYVASWKDQVGVIQTPPLFNIIQPGDRYIGLPFDEEWSEGSGDISAWTAKDDGKLLTWGFEGDSISGVGVYLETNRPASVAVTAIGSYSWNWSSFEFYPNVRSRGGIGVAVMAGDVAVASSWATLWNVAGAAQFTGGQGGGPLERASSGTSPFGPISLQPVLFDMHPGQDYVFWVWLWQAFQQNGASAFIATSQSTVQMIRVEAGPLITPPH